MSTKHDPRFFVRVDSWLAQLCLMWEGRNFWLIPSNCAPVALARPGDIFRLKLPRHFVEVNSTKETAKSAESLRALLQSRAFNVDWPKSEAEDRGKWPTVVSSAFARVRISYEAKYCTPTLGRRAHYYYLHPELVDCANLARAVDFRKESSGWHENPLGPLVVPFYDSFRTPGMMLKAIALLTTSLPNWTVKAPTSYMMRASHPPTISINTHGTECGRKAILQKAIRQSDAEAVCAWLGLPWSVYFKSIHSRFAPKGYIREAFKQGATDDQDRSSDLGDGAG